MHEPLESQLHSIGVAVQLQVVRCLPEFPEPARRIQTPP